MATQDPDIEDLLAQVSLGNEAARQELLLRYRRPLRQMIALRMDRRMASRLDPSDILQEVLADACVKLPEYLDERPLPFYPWLRQLAWTRLVKLHERHVQAQKRSVIREERLDLLLPDESIMTLASKLVIPGSTPSKHLRQEEVRDQVRAALGQLPERDREVLVMRYLEQLSTREIAAVLGISEGAVKVRHLRALQRLRKLLGENPREDEP